MPITHFSADALRSKVSDFAKGHRYNVIIIPPAAPNLEVAVTNNLQFLCESVSLPTKSLASNSHDIYGPPREIPYRTTFTEAAMSFILDDPMKVKNYFDKWQNYIINDSTGNPRYWDNFVGTINISRLLNNAKSVSDTAYKVELQEAYPSVVGEIALGHTGGNEILRLPVTFKFRKWINLVQRVNTGLAVS